MKQLYPKILIILVFSSSLGLAQSGVVSGTLTDDSGVPLAGVNVIIKNTATGTHTDFDGNYSISCEVGDVLVFEYISMETKETKVTSAMLGLTNINDNVQKVAVSSIFSDAYRIALNSKIDKKNSIPSISNANLTYNAPDEFMYDRIKLIDVQNERVKLTYFDPDIYFEIKYNSSFGVRFFQERNLPLLQNTFSQGSTRDGQITFLGPETGTLFSYGPKLSTLEFDGSNYDFDENGMLVALGNGNGEKSNVYDNSVLKTSTLNTNNLNFNVSSNSKFVSLNIGRAAEKDLFNKELSFFNEAGLLFEKKPNKVQKLGWKASIKFLNQKDNQPNINGFINNVLLNSWITPPSFSNPQGDRLANNAQRNFAPNDYNNPSWLLKNNINSERQNTFLSSLQNEYSLSEKFTLKSSLGYSSLSSNQEFGLPRNTNGFLEGYRSEKSIDENNFNANLKLIFNHRKEKFEFDAVSSAIFNNQSMDYSFKEFTGFETFSFAQPSNAFNFNNSLDRNILRLHNKFSIKHNKSDTKFEVTNNSYSSSLQNDKWFLPTLRLETDIVELLNIHFLNELTVSATTSYDVNDAPLFYNNFSHNSLNLLPSESLGYTANNDLFVNEDLNLEEIISHSLGATLRMYPLNLQVGFNYYNTLTKGSVFPVFDQDNFSLKNIADISNKGIELSLEAYVRLSNNFNYSPSILFSTYKPTVEKLNSDVTRIPIAGFASTSKNLIAGEVAGVIVGSAYSRDVNGNILIDAEGFPMVSENNKIIGNPIPDYNLSISNNFELGDFKLSVLLDLQKGGDVWNGTQNTLNYFGTSQLSAEQRGITDFIFIGVDANGQTNTTQVDFYKPENGIENNRFVRYGFEGVAEEAIVDGSYFNIKSINLSYGFDHKTDRFFRGFEVGLYANNILTISKFRGATPYNSLFGHENSQGLNFFNQPLESDVGLKLKLKI